MHVYPPVNSGRRLLHRSPGEISAFRCVEKGFEIVREFVEVESAKTAGRKQFAEMVTFFKRNRSCRILLVEKTDRLYRNLRDALTLEDLDIKIHFVKEGRHFQRTPSLK